MAKALLGPLTRWDGGLSAKRLLRGAVLMDTRCSRLEDDRRTASGDDKSVASSAVKLLGRLQRSSLVIAEAATALLFLLSSRRDRPTSSFSFSTSWLSSCSMMSTPCSMRPLLAPVPSRRGLPSTGGESLKASLCKCSRSRSCHHGR